MPKKQYSYRLNLSASAMATLQETGHHTTVEAENLKRQVPEFLTLAIAASTTS
ncbi:hypothetical protein [Pontibacter beigongshangensis]|uniref:hypothetical protein n=1 Tax=Pontibacter beigongshangensis TaxID=2574733 RepID=UPI00164F8002|nr:hypothetical protein [Pontibacter beigongshangensis]